jgi:hypothetical protein
LSLQGFMSSLKLSLFYWGNKEITDTSSFPSSWTLSLSLSDTSLYKTSSTDSWRPGTSLAWENEFPIGSFNQAKRSIEAIKGFSSMFTNPLSLQVKIHFEAFKVRYLWPLVKPQYQPFGSRLILHNPLGLSWGLKSSSTSPQNQGKAAAIAVPEEA